MFDPTPRATTYAYFFGAFCVAVLCCTGVAAVHAQNPDDVKQLLETRVCRGCDLRNAQLVTENLNHADLTGADLSGAFLYRATLNNAVLKDAKFDGADLKGASLRGATDANLAGAITDQATTCPSGRSGPCK